MKFLTLLSALISLNAHSFPRVGDYVRFEALFRGEKVMLEKELVEHYPEKNSYLQYTRITFRGEIIQEQTLEMDQLWFFTEEKIRNVLKNCTRREGALGKTEVQGQWIDTCIFHNEDAQLDSELGMVPFGQVRFQQFLGGEDFLDYYLISFKNGQKL